jgi:hypothetical protein
MEKLTIVFTKSKKKFPIFSWLIRLWTRKSYSHVARKMQISFLDEPSYFQANEGKVNWEYETYFKKKHEIVMVLSFDITKEERAKFNKLCWEQVGAPYGMLQNVGIVYVDIMKLLGIKVNNPWKKGMNCSEVLYRTIFKVRHPELDYDPDTIKPHHIGEIWKKYYEKEM